MRWFLALAQWLVACAVLAGSPLAQAQSVPESANPPAQALEAEALAAEQGGDLMGAIEKWEALVRLVPERTEVCQRLWSLRSRLDVREDGGVCVRSVQPLLPARSRRAGAESTVTELPEPGAPQAPEPPPFAVTTGPVATLVGGEVLLGVAVNLEFRQGQNSFGVVNRVAPVPGLMDKPKACLADCDPSARLDSLSMFAFSMGRVVPLFGPASGLEAGARLELGVGRDNLDGEVRTYGLAGTLRYAWPGWNDLGLELLTDVRSFAGRPTVSAGLSVVFGRWLALIPAVGGMALGAAMPSR